MNESLISRNALLEGAKQVAGQQRRRVSEVRAREHVGAAGWAQTSTLEQIIRAGREGLAATDALRQVVRLTTEQVRTLPLAAHDSERSAHSRALCEIVDSGEAQISAAEALDELICHALEDVARTPVGNVSVQTLRQIHLRVQEQVQALNTIVASAQAQAETLEAVTRLDRLSAEHQGRVDAIRHFSAGEEVQALAEAGESLIARIAELDEAGSEQLGALTRIGEAVAERVTDTAAPVDQQVEALDALARTVRQKAGELREA